MTKIISLTDDAYNYLKSFKGDGDSFSKVVMRMNPKTDRKMLLKLKGAMKDESFFKAMEEVIKDRKNLKFRTPKFD